MMEKINKAVNHIKEEVNFVPEFGIILGTGLGGLVKEIDIHADLSYEDIPHFPVSTVESHSGRLIFGYLGGKKVVIMQGRFHYYEGYSMQDVVFPVRVMKLLGIQKLFISNAAGGLNEAYKIADLMVIEDHIHLFPENPLTGKNLDELGPRFPDMSEPYDRNLITQGLEIAKTLGLGIHTGVYAGVPGPNLETKAEYQYLRIIGADAVGMSTVPEIIAARHMEIPCFAVSVITDLCYGEIKKVRLEEVIAAAMKAEPGLTSLFKELISKQP